MLLKISKCNGSHFFSYSILIRVPPLFISYLCYFLFIFLHPLAALGALLREHRQWRSVVRTDCQADAATLPGSQLTQPPALIHDLENSLCSGMTDLTLHRCWPQLKDPHLPYSSWLIFWSDRPECQVNKTFQLKGEKKVFISHTSKINSKVTLPCYGRCHSARGGKPPLSWRLREGMWLCPVCSEKPGKLTQVQRVQ